MTAPVVRLVPNEAPSTLDRAVSILEDGGLVVLPTDTVYGLCGRARPETVERIFAAKNRPLDRRLPLLIPDSSVAEGFCGPFTPRVRRLMNRWWPGAMTLVLGPDPGVAFRVPDHEFTRAVLRQVRFPIHATSANRSGDEPGRTAEEVLKSLGSEVQLIVDDGPSAATASCVVRVPSRHPIQILRPGLIPESELLREGEYRIAILCTGNTCRSPMAAAVLRHRLAARGWPPGSGLAVVSAGVAARPGDPMSPEAEAALKMRGVPAGKHRARRWDPEFAEGVDRILVMTPAHLNAIRASLPAGVEASLLDPEGGGVPDPFGGDQEAYESALNHMEALIDLRLGEFLPDHAPGTRLSDQQGSENPGNRDRRKP